MLAELQAMDFTAQKSFSPHHGANSSKQLLWSLYDIALYQDEYDLGGCEIFLFAG